MDLILKLTNISSTHKQSSQKPLPGRGGTLICSYIRRLGPLFLLQNFDFLYFGGLQKKKIFMGI